MVGAEFVHVCRHAYCIIVQVKKTLLFVTPSLLRRHLLCQIMDSPRNELLKLKLLQHA